MSLFIISKCINNMILVTLYFNKSLFEAIWRDFEIDPIVVKVSLFEKSVWLEAQVVTY